MIITFFFFNSPEEKEREEWDVSRLQKKKQLEMGLCSEGIGSIVMVEGQRKASAGRLAWILER